ncbi:Cut8 six-helix bundle-domain-containing protein [Scheffersomyces coipomensis]|uniref:Cut8 six-helix bundle-domain-containing protein n=1 Tax=Scheffersomyces coipomensis TaxID=1788519 RepID=UPI00315D6283
MISAGFHWGVTTHNPESDSNNVLETGSDNANTISTTSTSHTNTNHLHSHHQRNNHQATTTTTTTALTSTASSSLYHSKSVPRTIPKPQIPSITNEKKRKLDEQKNTTSSSSPPSTTSTTSTSSNRKYHELPTSIQRNKKSKTPRISGQSLPVSRLIEVLDHKSLQDLLQNLVNLHPEINNTINNLSPKPTIKDSMELLQFKFNQIFNHLPYKCDEESDYSYLRIKPYLSEFLNCLSDFILNFLPPIEVNIVKSLNFLHFITNLIHNLPKFSSNEFQYTKLMAYEQIANTWLIVLTQNIQGIELDDYLLPAISHLSTSTNNIDNESIENSIKLIKIVEELDLIEKLTKHNELSFDKFKHIIEFIKFEINQVENFNYIYHTQLQNGSTTTSTNSNPTTNPGSGPGGVFGDLITVDYSNFSITTHSSR